MRSTRLAVTTLGIWFLLAPATSQAVPMGYGPFLIDLVGDQTDNQICAWMSFADQTVDVFGVSVNLSTDMGQGVLCLASLVAGVPQTTTCSSYPDSSILLFTPETASDCPACPSASFVTVGDIHASGTFVELLGSGIAITADGYYDYSSTSGTTTLPGCPLTGTVHHFAGTAGLNAFETGETTTGLEQTVSFQETTFYNPVTGTEVPIDLDITFAEVTGSGTTTVTATSNAAGSVPGNFAVAVNGFQAAFLEISTTAAISPPIDVCSSYADADDDGFLDGTAPALPESALSFLHREDGTFVDRTSSRDAVANVICATVDSLSPFAIMVRTSGLCAAENDPCDDGDACTVTDLCNASLDCVGTGTPECDDANACTDDVCVSPAGCSHAPAVQAGCNVSNAKGSLLLKNVSDDTKDQLKFQWQKGTIALADFGSPSSETDYTLCAFDQNKLIASAAIPAGATCGENPCWTESTKGIKYADKTKPPLNDGVSQLAGTASTEAKAKLQLKLSGATMAPVDNTAISYPVTVQLRTPDACWEQTFTSGDEKKKDDVQLKLLHKAP